MESWKGGVTEEDDEEMMSHNDGLIAVPLAYIFPAIAEVS